MRAFSDRPATLPIAGVVLAGLHLALALIGLLPPERLPGSLLVALALAVAALLPALAPSLVAVGVLTAGGIQIGGIPVDGVLVGLLVLWQTTRRLGPWTRALALVGGLVLAGAGGIVVAFELSGTAGLSALPTHVEFLVLAVVALLVASFLSGAQVLVFVLALRAPIGPDDRVEALVTRVAGPQDPFSVGIAGGQGLVLLFIAAVPFTETGEAMQILLSGVFAVALVLHRRSPPLALAVAWFGAALQMSLQLSPSPADVAILVVLFGTGASTSRRVRTAGAVSAVLGSVVAVAYLIVVYDLLSGTADAPFTVTATAGGILATFGLSWTVGLLSRAVGRAREGQTLRAQAEQERSRAQRELDAVEERNRIARDMHDVVAHSLAVVIAQADGARYLGASSPEQTDAALLTISTVARDALGDVRVLLAQLRHSQTDGPQPGARDLPALLESVGSAGAPVRADLELDLDEVPRAVGLALYRIVQEATTNALRHGRPGSPIEIALRREEDELTLRVSNARRSGVESEPGSGGGHGLVGMRERAVLVGGALAARSVGEDFVVDARLPSAASPARDVGTAPPIATGGRTA
ncbi:sensor histidine kinase [Rathayibacter tanaceti]|uniref:histidine kinase n=2 Tax=Rathayibacter tanaceti TaxID=1671680 RepID=A0A166I4E5_9MICO|nr:histidine kinase [Rathayibacter tanaceti]KZX21611.1 Sensor histidine kinase DesK [Rathayibacter tanaceti]QHC55727.1 hypothetical protein GSU10_08850 [Rathayibacter tanaceti]TCO39461.1 signal transduction histidine kinase [Rathayibacter tanaceti]